MNVTNKNQNNGVYIRFAIPFAIAIFFFLMFTIASSASDHAPKNDDSNWDGLAYGLAAIFCLLLGLVSSVVGVVILVDTLKYQDQSAQNENTVNTDNNQREPVNKISITPAYPKDFENGQQKK
jgi:amino acid transporter